MRLAAPLLALLALVVASPARAHDPIVGTVTLGGREVRVEVEDRAKAPWQARRMLRVALRALPHVERIAGFRFPEERVRIEVFASKKETDASKRPWVGRALERFVDTDWHPNLTARLAVNGNTAELLLPVSALGSKGSVRLFPYTVSGEPLERVDAVGWLTVKLPAGVDAIPPRRGR